MITVLHLGVLLHMHTNNFGVKKAWFPRAFLFNIKQIVSVVSLAKFIQRAFTTDGWPPPFTPTMWKEKPSTLQKQKPDFGWV